ncbi:UPF0280 family protein [Metarhizobium album]|uniref:UPF0280 family protein n=1 Tax=Metarhizobium album TaxID=2182425 RepID=A0A2U2DRJ5_9HYPH|nr:UPF0280 family protein [Rhizobium album]
MPDDERADGRLHLQHGPIDLIIGVDGCDDDRRHAAFSAAEQRFRSVLEELVAELPMLKAEMRADAPMLQGSVARRMQHAVRPFASTHFITPMAAVAGAVADEILDTMLAPFPTGEKPARVYVNNGGDIALHLQADAAFQVKIAREDGATLGYFRVEGSSPQRGIATSGRGGRSLSFGIADSVTILAGNAASADAAASLVGNAVDLPGHPAIDRVPATDLVDDSDLGARLVVRACGRLAPGDVETALARGVEEAERFIAAGHIARAALFLQDQARIAEAPKEPAPFSRLVPEPSAMEHDRCLNRKSANF